MRTPISPNHPLRSLFAELIERRLLGTAQLDDRHVASYIAGLLVEFCHVENVYRIRDARGKRLEEVGEMLLASHPLLEGRSFVYEREVRKHIGDYTLFLMGLFPEHIARIHRKGTGIDAFIDYMKAGKESYAIVAAFNQFEFRDEAPLFRRLSDRFELCVFGLNLVKQDLAERQNPAYRHLRQVLG
jgi:hypothetical protein